ncbi:MAG: hypothetical protein VX815_00245 [Gemmatimonadota bacterium]|nr:hypothetical protein [Gemmatimonadota bacterium]
MRWGPQSAAPRPDPSIRGKRDRILLQGEVPSPVHLPTGCAFHTRCPHPERDESCVHRVPRDQATSRRVPRFDERVVTGLTPIWGKTIILTS